MALPDRPTRSSARPALGPGSYSDAPADSSTRTPAECGSRRAGAWPSVEGSEDGVVDGLVDGDVGGAVGPDPDEAGTLAAMIAMSAKAFHSGSMLKSQCERLLGSFQSMTASTMD